MTEQHLVTRELTDADLAGVVGGIFRPQDHTEPKAGGSLQDEVARLRDLAIDGIGASPR